MRFNINHLKHSYSQLRAQEVILLNTKKPWFSIVNLFDIFNITSLLPSQIHLHCRHSSRFSSHTCCSTLLEVCCHKIFWVVQSSLLYYSINKLRTTILDWTKFSVNYIPTCDFIHIGIKKENQDRLNKLVFVFVKFKYCTSSDASQILASIFRYSLFICNCWIIFVMQFQYSWKNHRYVYISMNHNNM